LAAVCLQPNQERLNGVSTGPLPQNLPHELDALRLKLIAMAGTDLAPEQTAALAMQISAIRLQLKRLAADQAVLGSELTQRALER
jgi:hypothetical protein